MSLGGIIVIIASVYGANVLSLTYSEEAVSVLRPFAAGYIDGILYDKDEKDGVLTTLGISLGTQSIEDYLLNHEKEVQLIAEASYIRLGITEKTAAELSEQAAAYYEENNVKLPDAITEILCIRISYVMCFTLVFLIILIALTVIGNLSNLSFKLPGFDLINDISGAVLGVATGIMFCTVLVWALKYLGMLIGADTLADTALAKPFLNADTLSKILGK